MSLASSGRALGSLMITSAGVRIVSNTLKSSKIKSSFRKATRGYPKVPKKKLKNMTWAQAKKAKPRLKPFADSDRDGVPNYRDCRPLNKKKHYVSRSPMYWAYRAKSPKF